jgi:uroporphyrinogen-III synthase
VFAALLERRGAQALRCPLVDIRDAPDPAPVLAWLAQFNAGQCDDLLLLTGEGLRRLLGVLDRRRPAWRARFVERLAEVRIVARGPKPGRVLRELGLRPSLVAEPATTPGMIACLEPLDLHGRRVGVQLYGSDPNEALMRFLAEAGAHSLPVAPYRYADAADDVDVLAMLARMRQGSIDAIAFTSLQQVERLSRLVEAHGQAPSLKDAMSGVVVAAVGPVVAEALARHGIRVQAIPSGSYYMKPLAQALIDTLAR